MHSIRAAYDSRMDPHLLATFVTVAQLGSFTRAADALEVTQPTVSVRIANLEAEVGGALFRRGRRAITLTELGRDFLPFAQRALEAISDARREAARHRQGTTGELRLGLLETLTGGFAADAVREFHAQQPTVHLTVASAHSAALTKKLLNGELDVAVVAWPCNDPLSVDMRPLAQFREPVHLVVHHTHPLATRKRVSLTDVGRLARPYLNAFRIPPRVLDVITTAGPVLTCPPPVALRYLGSGHGAAFLTPALTGNTVNLGGLTLVGMHETAQLSRDVALVEVRGRQARPKAARAFLQCLRDAARRNPNESQLLGEPTEHPVSPSG